MSSTTDSAGPQDRRRRPSATTLRDSAGVAGTSHQRTLGLLTEGCTDSIRPRPDEAS